MSFRRLIFAATFPLALAACGEAPYDPRGVDHSETLLSVSATGEAETAPDEAFFQLGVNSFSASARTASERNAEAIGEVLAALDQVGIPREDIQTRTVGIQKLEWGPNKGQFQASNVVAVTVRDLDKAGAAVTAASESGANVINGPSLRMAEPEAATNTAYGNAYRAARQRAEAYAEAADMQIARVLTIRDAGGSQGNRYIPGAPPPPRPVSQSYAPMAEQAMNDASGIIQPGQTTSRVSVQVDFALEPK